MNFLKPFLDLLLNRDKVYIIPTRYGVAFGFLNLSVIMVAATYSNNLVYLMSFILFAIMISSMVQTHVNFKLITFEELKVKSGHAGDFISITVTIKNETSADGFQITATPKFKDLKTSATSVAGSIPKLQHELIQIHIPVKKRGKYLIKSIRLSSIFPLGLWYTWKTYPINQDVYVYPQVTGQQPLPDPLSTFVGEKLSLAAGGDDFSGHRNYIQGDSFHHIDWKANARTRQLLIKKFDDGGQQTYELRWQDARMDESEDKISQLTSWIQDVHQKKEIYSLKIPGFNIGPDQSQSHFIKCMETLAIYGLRK